MSLAGRGLSDIQSVDHFQSFETIAPSPIISCKYMYMWHDRGNLFKRWTECSLQNIIYMILKRWVTTAFCVNMCMWYTVYDITINAEKTVKIWKIVNSWRNMNRDWEKCEIKLKGKKKRERERKYLFQLDVFMIIIQLMYGSIMSIKSLYKNTN